MLDAREITRKLVMNAARFSGLAEASRPLIGGMGAILMLHRVSATYVSPLGMNDHLAITPDFLDQVLSELKRLDYALIPLDEAVEQIAARRTGSSRFAAITLDDGYLDNLEEALPVFEAHEAPATIYIAPGLTSGETLPWWDTVEQILLQNERLEFPTPEGIVVLDCPDIAAKKEAASRLESLLAVETGEEEQQGVLHALGARDLAPPGGRAFMDWEEVRSISAHRLITIGAHTVNHYKLARLAEETARHEMAESARIIEAEIGAKPRHFAYPYGDADAAGDREAGIARELGFASAVTTRHGVIQQGHAEHLHALPRISVNGRFQKVGYVSTMLSGVTTPLANAGRTTITM